MRRVIAHRSVIDELTDRLAAAYARLPIGNPMAEGTLVGPLDPRWRVRGDGSGAIDRAGAEGGKLRRRRRPGARGGRAERVLRRARRSCAWTSRPTSSRRRRSPRCSTCCRTTTSTRPIALNNAVPQGLSSSMFTSDQAEAERFLSAGGLGLRHRQRQHRHLRRRDRWRLRRREGDRRRPRVRLGRVARLHAPGDQHHQLLRRAAPRPGRGLHGLSRSSTAPTMSSSPSSTVSAAGPSGM